MDALQNYTVSDSDESEDETGDRKQFSSSEYHYCISPKESLEKPFIKRADYFNLVSDSDEEAIIVEHDGLDATVHTEIYSELRYKTFITLPETVKPTPYPDWTKNVTVTESLDNAGPGHADASLSQDKWSTMPHNFDENRKVNQDPRKRRKLDVDCGKASKVSTLEHQSNSAVPFSQLEIAAVNAPIFVVHQRIKPHLHSSCASSNRLPSKLFRTWNAHTGAVNRIRWCCPQYSHLLLSASMDSSIKIWNVFAPESHKSCCVQTLAMHQKAVKDASWSSCGRQVLSGSFDRTVRVTDVEKATELIICEHQDLVSCVKYHAVDQNLFVSGSKNIILGWDLRCPPSKPIRRYTFKDKIGQVNDICFFADGSRFLSCNDLVSRDSSDRNIILWDFLTGGILSNQIYQERYTCSRLCVNPSQSSFIAQTQGDYIAQFSAMPPYRMNQCKRYEGHKVSGYDIGCDISPDGEFIISGSADARIVFYSYKLARTLRNLQTDDRNDVILNAIFHPLLSSTVAASTWSGSIAIWQ